MIVNPCHPSPCGPNSQCREINTQAVCSCVPGYIGAPPTCRPECTSSSECPLNEACVNQKCINPCLGTCGIEAKCQVVNHNPICSCPLKFTGNPFTRCIPISKQLEKNGKITAMLRLPMFSEYELPSEVLTNSCEPSPCGPNSVCQEKGSSPSCSCLPDFIGTPPNCRPECVGNDDCSNNQACISKRCINPCNDICGINAECHVVNHIPNCVCLPGYLGDPFSVCTLPGKETIQPDL